ncbi:MAG: YIP1 family protein [Clostridia bacterium]|nr:YIP1 family protein [Clostridia bacterium]
MKNKLSKILILSLILVMVFGTVYASAFESYDTYTYSIDGEPLKSPTAYTPVREVDYKDMDLGRLGVTGTDLKLKAPTDVVTDNEGNVYIVDRENNRIVVLNKYYTAKAIIDTYVDDYGKTQTFSSPNGIFVTDPTVSANQEKFIYICDTENERIVIFDEYFNYSRTIYKPESALVNDFKLDAIAVDKYGRIFAVSKQFQEGVIVLSNEGDFTGFIGAQKVSYSVLEMVWRNFQSKEQRQNQVKNLSVAYNNITVDTDGFVYVTNDQLEASKQFKAIKSKSAENSPVKKLNSAGNEIMKRNGFFDPGGEVAVSTISPTNNVSKIIDIAIGPNGSWTILDNAKAKDARMRMFTYDQNGNLLFAFGDKGDLLGQGQNFVSITYQEVDGVTYLIALDNTANKFTVYAPTAYCDTIMKALENENLHNYSESIKYWQEVLTKNNNFDLAYIGIGKALYSQGKFDESMEMLSKAYETAQYSKAFAETRKDLLGKWLIPLLILIIALCVGLVKFLGWAKKKNKATSLKVGRKTYVEELLFVFHLVFHPFDGFWDLKHEKRGSVRGGLTIMGLTILAFFYQSIGKGYIFNPRDTYSTIFVQILAVGVPVLLWCVGNWCLTTLFEGEGGFKDIFIATSYSLAPLIPLVIVSTILTNVLTATEGSMVNLLVTIGYVWVAFLLFFGMLVTHDYALGKNVLITICTIVAMAVIMFVAILFSSLVMKMVTFVIAIIKEIANRA